jgi:hypothetical protein
MFAASLITPLATKRGQMHGNSALSCVAKDRSGPRSRVANLRAKGTTLNAIESTFDLNAISAVK